ncbi:SAV_915 family protein [Streptomyces sp. NPDC047071]|uniref:SAV_915 family protein n=1 Tax=Streptomyces sp. NPDC047071 TaxID=3154808 RepID=UPI003451E44A
MTQPLVCGEDPEPAERGPAGPLFVPVRPGPAGCVARLFRTPVGGRTAVAFTSEQRLAATLGARQPWIRLSEPALRALTEPLGVTGVTVDPGLTSDTPVTPVPPVTVPSVAAAAAHRPPRRREWDPQAAGAPRVSGAAALVGALTAWIG